MQAVDARPDDIVAGLVALCRPGRDQRRSAPGRDRRSRTCRPRCASASRPGAPARPARRPAAGTSASVYSSGRRVACSNAGPAMRARCRANTYSRSTYAAPGARSRAVGRMHTLQTAYSCVHGRRPGARWASVPGAGADQLRPRPAVEPVGVRQRHGDAGGEGGLGRIGAHAVAELRQRFRPAARVAQRAPPPTERRRAAARRQAVRA